MDCPSATTDEPRDDQLNVTTLTSQMGRQTETFRSYSEVRNTFFVLIQVFFVLHFSVGVVIIDLILEDKKKKKNF